MCKFEVDLCKTARSCDVKNCVLISSNLEISTCSCLWMFFTKKRIEQEKKKTSTLKKKKIEKKTTNPGMELGSTRLERGC